MTRIMCKTKDMSRSEWLEARRKGIGGSDAAAVVGISRYKGPIGVFLDKTDDKPPEVLESSLPSEDLSKSEDVSLMFDIAPTEVGIGLEDYVADIFQKVTGKKCAKRNAILQNNDHDWMLANIDRWVVGENAGLEIKTASSYMKDDWEDGKIPPAYELQCHHYMAVTDADRWYIACLIGNRYFAIRTIKRDEETIRYLIDVEKDFWNNHVMKKIMPPPDGSDGSAVDLKTVYPQAEEGRTVDLDDLSGKLDRLKEVKRMIKKLEEEESSIEHIIEGRMGDAETAWIGTDIVTWKNRKGRETVDTDRLKADGLFEKYKKTGKPYRVFSLKNGGKKK